MKTKGEMPVIEQIAPNHNEVVLPKPVPPRQPFTPTSEDGLLAIFVYALGFLFWHWVFFTWQGLQVTLFTALFGILGALYFKSKGLHMSRESYFWLAMLQLTGLSFALWQNDGFIAWRPLFLFCFAVYWVIATTKMTLLGKTSDYMPLDFLNVLLGVAFRYFGSHYKSLFSLRKSRSLYLSQAWPFILGVALSLLLLTMVLPLLLTADSGAFAVLVGGLTTAWRNLMLHNAELATKLILAIPTASYLFGLIAGCVHGAKKQDGRLKATESSLAILRILPLPTVLIVMGMLTTVYLLFISSQLPYFFSAFAGELPSHYITYAEFARRGFFELCAIAVINLAVLTIGNLSSQTLRSRSFALRLQNILLSVLTLLLIATAFSKMLLYVDAFGLTMPRLLPLIFMLLLSVICCAIIALQKWQFSIMRLTAIVGALAFSLLTLVNLDGYVANYNAHRYLSGTLRSFDIVTVQRAGPAGVNAALLVYDETDDQVLRRDLASYLNHQLSRASSTSGKSSDTLENALVRGKLARGGWDKANAW